MHDSIQENNYMINDLANIKEDLLPGFATDYSQDENKFHFYCDNQVVLFVHVLTDKLIRFRYSTNGDFTPDFSYAIAPDFRARAPKLEFKEKSDHFRITTNRVICTIRKEGLQVRISDKSGDVLMEDEKGFHWEYDLQSGNDIVK